MTENEDLRADVRRELVKALVPLAINVLLIVAITKRDEITRMGLRIRNTLTHQRQREKEDVAVAELRREIAMWEHAERDKG